MANRKVEKSEKTNISFAPYLMRNLGKRGGGGGGGGGGVPLRLAKYECGEVTESPLRLTIITLCCSHENS